MESGVKWAFEYDRSLPQPYEDKLNAYLNEPAFKDLRERSRVQGGHKIQRAGNRAVHDSKPPTKLEAVEVLSALFSSASGWRHATAATSKPDLSIEFDPNLLPDARRGRAAGTRKRTRRSSKQRLDDEVAQAARGARRPELRPSTA